MHSAALKGRAEVVKTLLEFGAEVNPANASGDTPYQDALDNEHDEVVCILKERGGEIAKDIKSESTKPKHSSLYLRMDLNGLIKACKDKDIGNVRYLLNSRIMPNHECVVAAIQSKNDEIVDLVFKTGAPLDDIDEEGKTPMVYAIERGNNHAIRRLIVSAVPESSASILRLPSWHCFTNMAPKENGVDATRCWPIGKKSHYHEYVRYKRKGNWEGVYNMLRAMVYPQHATGVTEALARARLAPLAAEGLAEHDHPPLPAGLQYAMDNPLPAGDWRAPMDGYYTLLSFASPLKFWWRRHIDPECPPESAEEEWCANYQVSTILGHSDLTTLRSAVAAIHEGRPGPATLPFTDVAAERICKLNIALMEHLCTTRNWMYMTPKQTGKTQDEILAMARAEGFEGIQFFQNGAMSVSTPQQTRLDTEQRFKDLVLGGRLFWVRVAEAEELVAEAARSQERLKGFRPSKEDGEGLLIGQRKARNLY